MAHRSVPIHVSCFPHTLWWIMCNISRIRAGYRDNILSEIIIKTHNWNAANNPRANACGNPVTKGPQRGKRMFPPSLGHTLKLLFGRPSENRFWSETGRRGRYGRETTSNRQHFSVRIQWTASRTAKFKSPTQKSPEERHMNGFYEKPFSLLASC